MGKEVFVSVLLSGNVFVARVDLYIDMVDGISGGHGGDIYFLDNRL